MLTGKDGANAILNSISESTRVVQASTNNPPAQTILVAAAPAPDPVPVSNVVGLGTVQPSKVFILAALAGIAYMAYKYKR